MTRYAFLMLGITLLTGCGKVGGGSRTDVSGKVSFKNTALAGAMVQFIPMDKSGDSASGRTDASGMFTLVPSKGGKGLPAGEYKVVISRFVGPDGKELPADVSPFSGGGKRNMPSFYSNPEESFLTATVPAAATATIDFPLTGQAGGALGGAMGAAKGAR